MKTSSIIMGLMAVASLLLAGVMPLGAAVIFQDNFEANALGTQPPTGWLWASGGALPADSNGVITAPPNAVPANGSRVMNYFDNSATGFGYVYNVFTAPSLDSGVSFSFDFNCQSTTAYTSFVGLGKALGATGFWLNIASTGGATGSAGIQGDPTALSFNTGQWYHVSIKLSPASAPLREGLLTITSLSGGPDPGSDTFTYADPSPGINQILLAQNGGVQTGLSLYLDNFDLQTLVPEPSAGALLLVGGGLLLRRRRK